MQEQMGNISREMDILYVHKFDKEDETDQFLERHNLLKHPRRNSLNKPISIKDSESTI